MKKLNKKAEFEKMQKMYSNCPTVCEKMDLVTFSFKYYDDLIKKYEELRKFWGSSEPQKFLDAAAKEQAENEKAAPVDETKKEETPEEEIARLKAKLAELEAAKPVEKKKKVIIVRKKPAPVAES